MERRRARRRGRSCARLVEKCRSSSQSRRDLDRCRVGEEEIDVETMKLRYAALLADRNTLLAERDRFKKLYDDLLFEKERLERQLVGPKAERVKNVEAQQQLPLLELLALLGRLKSGDESAVDEAEAALQNARELLTSAETDKPPCTKNRGAPHGRRRPELEDLPARQVVIEPPERT